MEVCATLSFHVLQHNNAQNSTQCNDALGTLVKLVRFGQIFRFVKIVQNMYLTQSHRDIEIGIFCLQYIYGDKICIHCICTCP